MSDASEVSLSVSLELIESESLEVASVKLALSLEVQGGADLLVGLPALDLEKQGMEGDVGGNAGLRPTLCSIGDEAGVDRDG